MALNKMSISGLTDHRIQKSGRVLADLSAMPSTETPSPCDRCESQPQLWKSIRCKLGPSSTSAMEFFSFALSSAIFTVFFWREGSPTKIDPYSNLSTGGPSLCFLVRKSVFPLRHFSINSFSLGQRGQTQVSLDFYTPFKQSLKRKGARC